MPGPVAANEARFQDERFQLAARRDVAHVRHLTQQSPDGAPVVAPEVRPHSRAKIGRLADVQHTTDLVHEQINAHRVRQ